MNKDNKIASTSDPSIFSWQLQRDSDEQKQPLGDTVYCGVLAPSPAAFRHASSLKRSEMSSVIEYTVTNLGIKSRDLVVTQYSTDESSMRYLLPITANRGNGSMQAVRLRKCGAGLFLHEDPWTLLEVPQNFQISEADKHLLIEETSDLKRRKRLGAPLQVARTRAVALQMEHCTWVMLSRASPSSTFDVQDQVFFIEPGVSQGSHYDRALLRLVVRPYNRKERKWATEAFECWLIALGWASVDGSDLVISLVERNSTHRQNLEMLESRAAVRDVTTKDVLRMMTEYRIPRVSVLRFRDTEGDRTIVVHTHATLTMDDSVCPSAFWKIKITCEEELQSGAWLPQSMASAAYQWLMSRQESKVTLYDYESSALQDWDAAADWGMRPRQRKHLLTPPIEPPLSPEKPLPDILELSLVGEVSL
ncbi:uncharacterized protein AB675_3865 [Cyphellophora attinorum]|uniref:Uncharacterized protein n=1 Tax=Cyphellophora attinorum TaxID=1664694 RepID=A0A0N0NHQ0_9EURO|nr:uncharacterized protein AB675_3865 [Phialophora attinorum]KPI34941.1 hypothetical protein AB675_3865 [Phialophora attinorum]